MISERGLSPGTTESDEAYVARRSYAHKVYAAVHFIESNLTASLDLQAVCRHVGVSKFYFSRIFQSTVGETVFDYVRKRRLTEIARRLFHTDTPICDLAFDYGYETQQSMTKAFRRFVGVSPGRYRREGVERFFYRREPFSLKQIESLASQVDLRPAVVSLPPLRIVGLRRRMPISSGDPVEQARRDFRHRAGELRTHRKRGGYFEVTLMTREDMVSFVEDGAFDGLIGYDMTTEYAVSPGEMELTELVIPEQRYLSFRYTGNNAIAALTRMYRHIFSTGLLRRSETLAEGSFFHYYPGDQQPGYTDQASLRFLLPIC